MSCGFILPVLLSLCIDTVVLVVDVFVRKSISISSVFRSIRLNLAMLVSNIKWALCVTAVQL